MLTSSVEQVLPLRWQKQRLTSERLEGLLARMGIALACCAATFVAALLAAELGTDDWSNTVAGTYRLAFIIFLVSWRLAGNSPARGAVLGAWTMASTAMTPAAWLGFFGSDSPAWGGMVAWAAIGLVNASATAAADAAARALVSEKRRPFLAAGSGIAAALIVTAVPPLGYFGMGIPLLAAGSFFPATGVFGYLLLIAFSTVFVAAKRNAPPEMQAQPTAIQSAWHCHASPMIWLAGGLLMLQMAAHCMAPRLVQPSLPINFVGIDVAFNTDRPPLPGGPSWYDFQDKAKAAAAEAIERGAKLVVLPEGSVSRWDSGSTLYWSDLADNARAAGAHVLLGAYTLAGTAQPGHPQPMDSTLLDLTAIPQSIYKARASLPVGMWRPWASDGDTFTMSMSAGTGRLEIGEVSVLYTLCYEDILAWPLAFASLGADKPRAIVSTASNWFVPRGRWNAQSRMIHMQAALYGLPLLRAVSYSPAAL